MTDENWSTRVRALWSGSFWSRVGAEVVAALIVLGTVGGGAAIFELPARDVLLYFVLLVVALALIGATLYAGRAVRRQSGWRADVDEQLLVLGDHLRRLHIAEVIHSAQANGWQVCEEEHRLVFRSSDDDVLTVDELTPSPDDVAERLHNLAPTLWKDEKWKPWVYSANVEATLALRNTEALDKKLDERTTEVSQRMREVALQLQGQIARTALRSVVNDADLAGWQIRWDDEHATVVFEKDGDTATVSYGGIDIGKLRAAMKLPPNSFSA